MNKKDNWQSISFFILFFGGGLLLLFPFTYFFSLETDIQIVVSLLSVPLFSLAAVLIPCGIYHGKDMWQELKLKPLQKSDILPILSVFGVFLLFIGLTSLWTKVSGKVNPQFLVAYAADCPLWIFCLVLFSAGVLAPVAEELVFRRTIAGFCSITSQELSWIVYFVPSFLFALTHGFAWQSFLLFFFALYLQWNQIHGSTSRCILMHALFNWCTLTILILSRAGVLTAD